MMIIHTLLLVGFFFYRQILHLSVFTILITDNVPESVFTLFTLSLFICIIIALYELMCVRRYKKGVNSAIQKNREAGEEGKYDCITITEEGFWDGEEFFLDFPNCSRVVHRCGMLLIYSKKKRVYPIPDESIENGTWEEVYRFVKEKIRR